MKRNTSRRTFGALTCALLACLNLLGGCSSTSSEPLPDELVGVWSGRTRVIVTWVEREELDLELEIARDGGVTGTVGDARLVRARCERNRGDLGRELGIKTVWIVRGDLEGELIADEGLRRDAVSIPIDLREGRLEGGLHSSGSKLPGDPAERIVSAADLVLERR